MKSDALCFVMMPYGGSDVAVQKRFEGVFQNIISAAAMGAGFSDSQIIREDHKGDAGIIIKNVINHIALSSVVIADLTGGNANVHYELGLSHVFHKSSTVLICEKGTELPFDLQSLNVIQYSTNIDSMAESVKKIRVAIEQRLDGLSSADNVVHAYIPSLPANLLDLLENNESELQQANQRLSVENENLRRRLEAANIDDSDSFSLRTVKDLLASTKERYRYSGKAALDKLKSLADDDDIESFLDYLTNVLDLGSPSVSDLNNILEVVEKIDNPVITENFLVIANRMFPEETTFITKLGKIYAQHPTTKGKALEMVNSAIGLKTNGSGAFVSVDRSKLTHNVLARFLDTYIVMEAYSDLVKVAEFLMTHGAETEARMLNNNILSAYVLMGDLDSAKNHLPIVEAAGTAPAYYNMSKYYDKIGDHASRYICIEKAFLVDPFDLDYPYILAIINLNENIIRLDADTIAEVSGAAAKKSAAAFLYYVLENDRSSQQALATLSRAHNRMGDYLRAIYPFLKGNKDAEIPYSITNRYPLDYLLNLLPEE